MQDLQLQCKARENWENSDNHFIIHSHSFCLMRLLLKKSKGQCVNTNPNLKISRRPNKLTLEYQDGFFFIFQKNSAMATLGLKEMGKFLWEGRENDCLGLAKLNWDSQLGKLFSLPFQKNFSHFLQT